VSDLLTKDIRAIHAAACFLRKKSLRLLLATKGGGTTRGRDSGPAALDRFPPGSSTRGSLAMTALFAAGLGVTGDRNDQARRTSGGHGAQRERRRLAAGAPETRTLPGRALSGSARTAILVVTGSVGRKVGKPVFMFQEGTTPAVERAFQEIAAGTGGAYAKYDAGAAKQLGELLKAVVHYATGGMAALKKRRNAGSALLIEQLWDASTPGPMAPNE